MIPYHETEVNYFLLMEETAMLAMRRERIKRGWSLMDLAMRCRIDPGALSRIERQVWRSCGPGWRRRIAEAFGMPEEYLFSEVSDDEHERQ